MCAVHCLNTLLQGSYFTEVELSTIAQQFDEAERKVMAAGGMVVNFSPGSSDQI